ncbi:MOSC beta barrel domain protein [Oesophagostomum dentatum]|uniref:MOSC beta barrel domain protein n=1 Tax=Oesophagostomum dentatum TaxID=61180 RepID=A0A0B1TVL1_OESDE|nr:MOSC beta barrel domain protein [Oesophagostomum dentatum]
MVLEHFEVTAEQYAVVFTANTTHALQIVADSFSFGEKLSLDVYIGVASAGTGPTFAYLRDSHNSVVGMREIVKTKVTKSFLECFNFELVVFYIRNLGACHTSAIFQVDNIFIVDNLEEQLFTHGGRGLFAMTAMSNFCGRKYDLSIIDTLQNKGWSVCLDAAALVSSSPLSLEEIRPHFMAISFYKMFGYPTGLGALLIRRQLRTTLDAVSYLTPRTFAGGTVSQILVDELHSVVRENIEERLEYGTLNYYAICALAKGFSDLKRYGGIQAIHEKTMRIARAAYERLKTKVHWNGKPAVVIYGWLDTSQQGPIVTFNVLRDDGSYVGYSEVEKMTALFGIELRTGCFCNSGACQTYLNISNKQLLDYYEEGKRCGDEKDLIEGRPTGAIRISFGRQSVDEDVTILVQMIDYCFLGVQPSSDINFPVAIDCYSARISRLIVYPVKSCRGIVLKKSYLTKTGLRYDRIFMVESCGTVLTQKREPKMCKLLTKLDESAGMLVLSSTEDPTFSIRVSLFDGNEPSQARIVCVNNIQTSECALEATTWLTSFLKLPDCKLRRVQQYSNKSLSNEAPYLVVNEASIKTLADAIGISTSEAVHRFRPNLVIRGIPPFIEDTAKYIIIDNFRFEVIKKCTRCEMICVNPATGAKEPQLIVALRNFRGKQKMTFGIYAKQIGEEAGVIYENSNVHFE